MNRVHILSEVVDCVKRRALMFIVLLCIGFLVTITYVSRIPNVYLATVSALPPSDRSAASGWQTQAAGIASMAGIEVPTGEHSSEMLMAILASRRLHEALIDENGLKEFYKSTTRDGTLDRFRADWVARLDKRTGVIMFGFSSTNPQLSAEVANSASVLANEIFNEVHRSDSEREREFMQDRLRQAIEELQAASKSVAEFQLEHHAIEIESQAKAAVATLGELHGKLIAHQIELKAARTSSAGEDSPQVKALTETISAIEAEIKKLHDNGLPGYVIGLRQVPELAQRYLSALRDQKKAEALVAGLSAQLEGAKLAEARNRKAMIIIDRAAVPDRKSGPKRVNIIIGCASCWIPLLLVFLLWLDRRGRVKVSV